MYQSLKNVYTFDLMILLPETYYSRATIIDECIDLV